MRDKEFKTSMVSTEDVLCSCLMSHREAAFANKTSLQCLQIFYPNFPIKVLYRAMERECDKGLIEYGTSLCTAWVTF